MELITATVAIVVSHCFDISLNGSLGCFTTQGQLSALSTDVAVLRLIVLHFFFFAKSLILDNYPECGYNVY